MPGAGGGGEKERLPMVAGVPRSGGAASASKERSCLYSNGCPVKQTLLPCLLPSLHSFQESVLSLDLPERGYVYFKFEPFVLHVVCSTLEDARLMVLHINM